MSRILPWNWLGSHSKSPRGRVPARARPCLAPLEQLEDRIVLNSTFVPPAAPIPLSQQSLNAVTEFLTEQGQLIAGQTSFVQAQTDLINQTGDKLPSAAIDFFLTIDSDLVQFDTDLVGSAGSTGSTGSTGIDTVMTYFALPLPAAINLEATLIPTVGLELQATNAVIAQLQNATVGELTKTEGIKLEADVVELKTNTMSGNYHRFAQIEYQLIGADANDLGPPLGLQGSTSPGLVGGLLQDLTVLASDAAVGVSASTSGSTSGSTPAADSFAAIESAFVADQNAFLQLEGVYLRKKLPGKMKSGTITLSRTYFVNIDADLIQIDNDLIGAPSAAAGQVGGVDGTLLTLKLSQKDLTSLANTLVPAVQAARATAIADQAAVQQISDANTTTFDIAGLEAAAELTGNQLALGVAGIEHALIQLDSGAFSPALGLQGSASPGLVGGLLQDATVLMSDAGGQAPTDIVYPPPAVVDAFLTFEGAMIQNQNSFLASEQTYLKLGVQLPAAIVDYFLQIDDALLDVDSGLVGPPGPAGPDVGVDGVLLQLGLPATYMANIQNNLIPAVQSIQKTATADVTALQQNAGASGPATSSTLLVFSKLTMIQLQEQVVLGNLSLSFGQIENALNGLDPTNQTYIQDSKNISDGAAKGQAVD